MLYIECYLVFSTIFSECTVQSSLVCCGISLSFQGKKRFMYCTVFECCIYLIIILVPLVTRTVVHNNNFVARSYSY